MLRSFPDHPTQGSAHPHPGAAWIDLMDPTEAETALVTQVTGLRIPSRAILSEIESSSRLQSADEVLTLSMPLVTKSTDPMPVVSPVGFVLAKDRLVTIRYQPATVFDTFAETCASRSGPCRSSMEIMVGLLEAIVDRMADVMERVGGDLDQVSSRIFNESTAISHRPAQADAALRATLHRVGTDGDRLSKIRDTLLGVGRIVPYVSGIAQDWIPETLQPRFKTLQQDIASLNDYEAHLSNKVQFLLDATLGFINIEQNVIIKVLTIVTVVGIPPVVIAGIYGMNFKIIPELSWAWGYPYSLILMVVSALLPLWWFKKRGWI